MGFLDGFIKRVIDALEKGKKLAPKDIARLKRILEKRKRVVTIASRATIAALLMSARKEDGKIDEKKFKKNMILLEMIIDMALKNAEEGKPLFSKGMRKKLVSIFNEMGLNGEDTARKFIAHFDEMLAIELKESMENIKLQKKEEKKVVPRVKEKEAEVEAEGKKRLKVA